MVKGKQEGLGDELFGTRLGEWRDVSGPVKGEFVSPPDVSSTEEIEEALPEQEEFWRPPARFGAVPVEANPLGWDPRRGFRKLYPQVMLPTQVVDRVSFGHPELEPNRLFWGDNLHVMRQLPSQSIDLIYMDPPFFSGKQYNILFGDQNELRSFIDIWEAGLPGYLIWLNARLYEMKRLLKKTGTIWVHLDYHAVHYVKQELDKIFGHDNFINEVNRQRQTSHSDARQGTRFLRRLHDTILLYSKSPYYQWFNQYEDYSPDYVKRNYRHVEDIAWVIYQAQEANRRATPITSFWEYVSTGNTIRREWRSYIRLGGLSKLSLGMCREKRDTLMRCQELLCQISGST